VLIRRSVNLIAPNVVLSIFIAPPDQAPAPTCSSEAHRRRIVLAQSVQLRIGRKVLQSFKLQIVGHIIGQPEFVEQAILGNGVLEID